MKDYKLIIFDLGNTIIKFDHHISSRKIAERFGLDEERIYETFFDSELTRAFDTGRVSPRQFYSETAKALGIDVGYEEFVDTWSAIFWEDEGSCGLARRLKAHYKLCLMSNVNVLHFEYIKRKFDIIAIFDHIVLSYIVGALKPDRRMFERASSLSGIEFSHMLYIDDREELVEGARALDIESIAFKGASSLERWLEENKVLA